MRTYSTKSKIVVAAVTAGTLSLSGVAYAYWTTTGGGSGSASTRPGATNVLSVAGNVASAVYPGDSAQTVTAVVTNTGSENYKVQTLSAWVDTDQGASCDGSNYNINGTAAPTTAATAVDLGITPKDLIPATGTQSKTFTFGFNNKTTNQDLCKSAAVTIHYIAG